MGRTIESFLQFVKDDPIMLALCLAIGVLLLLFIIVLFLGKNADKKYESKKKEEQMMKTEVNLNIIRDASTSVKDNPIMSDGMSFSSSDIEPVPVEIGGASKIEVPVLNSNSEQFSEFPHIEPIETRIDFASVKEKDIPVFDSPMPLNEENMFKGEILESSVNPVDSSKNMVSQREDSGKLKDIYGYDNVELPEINVGDFSKTSIMNHISGLDKKQEDVKLNVAKEPEEDEDVDLPKLNTANQSKSAFNLMGESFDIPKNS